MGGVGHLGGRSAREATAWSPVRSAPFQNLAPHLSPPTWVLSLGDAERRPPAAAGPQGGGRGGVSLGRGGRARAGPAAETQTPSEQETVANAVTGDRGGHRACVPTPDPSPPPAGRVSPRAFVLGLRGEGSAGPAPGTPPELLAGWPCAGLAALPGVTVTHTGPCASQVPRPTSSPEPGRPQRSARWDRTL